MSESFDHDALAAQLTDLMSRVRLRLERADEGWVIGYEKERHPVPRLPLSDLDPAALQAELLAIAAGFDAAVKFPLELQRETFREGAATLMPRIERARFVEAYELVVQGRAGGDDDRLFTTDFGGGLIITYVRDEGWRFQYITRAQVRRWDVSPGTIHACGRSNLYARTDEPYYASDTRVSVGDSFDADRAVLMDDVFYARQTGGAIRLAVPSRKVLLVGEGATPEAAREAFEGADYPLSPHVLTYKKGVVEAS